MTHVVIFEEFRHATKLKSIYFTCNYRKRNGRHNKKSNMADDPYLDCTVGQDSAVMNENPLYFITNIEEDDDTHVWTDRKRYQRKSDLDSIALAGPGLFVFYMYVVFLWRVESGHWHHFDDFDNERESDQWPCRLYGLQKVWQLIPPFLSLLAVFSHMFSHLVPKTIDVEVKTWNIFKNLYMSSYCHVYTHVLVFI